MTLSLSDLLQLSAERHSQLCPRQVLGVRMGLAGMAALGLETPMSGKTALVIIETDGCFATGIEVATGASIGHRTLRVVDLGKAAATFTNIQTGKAIRLAPAPDVRQRAALYCDERHPYVAQLNGYQLMPAAELFTYREVSLKPPVESLISQPNQRVNCAICGEEIINQREIAVEGKVLCQTCAGHSYYATDQRSG